MHHHKRITVLIWLAALLIAARATVQSSAPQEPPAEKAPRTDVHGDPLPPGALARLGTVRLRHAWIKAVVFSPDGKTLASLGKRDGMVRLWDVATGREKGHIKEQWNALAFSKDGRTLTAITGEGILAQWDLHGKKLRTLREYADSPTAAAFSPDGELASVAFENMILLWDAITGEELHRLRGHTSLVPSLVFSRDGKVLASGSLSSHDSMRVWDVTTGREIARFSQDERDERIALPLALSPDGKILVSADDEQVDLWDIPRRKRIRSFGHHNYSIASAAFTSDGRVLVTNPQDGELSHAICFWRVSDGKEIRRWEPTDAENSLAFSPDDKLLAVGGLSNTIRLFDLVSGKELHVEKGSVGPVEKVSFTADGRSVVTSASDGSVRLWDAATGRLLRRFPFPIGWEYAFACAPDGSRLAVLIGKTRPSLHLWNLATGAEIRRFDVKGNNLFVTVAFSPDGKTLVVTAGEQDTPSFWDVATGKEVRSLSRKLGGDYRAGPPITSLALSPDGRWLAASLGLGIWPLKRAEMRLWNLATGRERSLRGQPDVLTSPVFSSDGKTLFALEEPPDRRFGKNVVRRWEVESGQPRRLKLKEAGDVSAFALAPSGEVLATAEEPHHIRLWDIATGEELRHFDGHRGEINSLAFASDGRTLVSGSADTTALLWDVDGVVNNRKRHCADLPPRQLDALWGDLGGGDAERAGESIWTLITGRQTVAFLKERLHPVAAPDVRLVARQIAELDSADFSVRQRAMRALAKQGEKAVPSLRKALADHPSLEVRLRIEQILGRQASLSLQLLRAVEVLEHIGSREARQVLQTLADGMPEARLTEEAKASLKRLDKRSGHRP